MGNCLKGSSNDDVSLLRENDAHQEITSVITSDIINDIINEPLQPLQFHVSDFQFVLTKNERSEYFSFVISRIELEPQLRPLQLR